MTRRDALIRVIDCLHAEIAALKANDIAALERATRDKLSGIEVIAANDDQAPPSAEIRELAEEANRLNETCRIYVNLMTANVRRRLQQLAGTTGNAYGPGPGAYACA
ncbi:flagellar protein FlgN [Hephaestia sp. GCM10023244]|uniref:flagellar protein FlgN n=1 Tax=unclassified Hephaestia TaxID=2631281 RepID=UPI002076FFBE|nr:flagellar protein FlgN [Hephaestia sp. MAHUQ-44]MCM8731252.1 flagellar protein FlgN [Hephaestia sp. MAHUQ-44]